MKIIREHNVLEITGGSLFPSHQVDPSRVVGWKFVAEENGATYFEFQYSDSAQHVSIVTRDAKGLQGAMKQLRSELRIEPDIEVHDSRINTVDAMLVLDMLTLGTISTILTTAALGAIGYRLFADTCQVR